MKNSQKGFAIPLIIAIIAVLAIGSGVYLYMQSKCLDCNGGLLMQPSLNNVNSTSTTNQVTSNQSAEWQTYTNTVNGYSISYPSGTNIDNGDANKVVFQPNTTKGNLTIQTTNSQSKCLDTTSGADPTNQTINGVNFVVYNLDRVLSTSYVSVTAREYCAVNNALEYKIISKLPYIGTPINVDKDEILNKIIQSFLITSIQKSPAKIPVSTPVKSTSLSLPNGSVIGFIWQADATGPQFASVALPKLAENQKPYQIYLWNGSSFFFYQNLAPGTVLSFPGGSVNKFEILGVDPSLGICRTDGFLFDIKPSGTGSAKWTKAVLTNNIVNTKCSVTQ